jgi:hypothetical protein
MENGAEVRHMDELSVDETMRMIARIPAPEGLEERVKAGLHLAEKHGRVLAWPTAKRPRSARASRNWVPAVWIQTGWARGAAAAAIALAVAGGGWGIYSRVAPAQSAKTLALPQAQPSGSFSEAGAMRRPPTLTGPKAPGPAMQQIQKKDAKAAPGAMASDAPKVHGQGSPSGVPTSAK